MTTTNDYLLALVNALPDPVFVLTESGLYADIVGGQASVFYHDSEFLIGKNLSDVLAPEKVDWFLAEIKKTLDHGSLRVVEYNLAGDDVDGLDSQSGPLGVLRFEGRVTPLPGEINGERAVIWIAINISEKHQMLNEIKRLSMTDDLTGANNRRSFDLYLSETFGTFTRYKDPVSLALIDIDWFKQINDKHGHTTGDDMLKQFSLCCRSVLRDADFMARIGGDEFSIIFPQTKIEDAARVVERLRQSLEAQPERKNAPKISISVGISSFRESDPCYTTAFERADKALYKVKHNGRNDIEVS